MLAMQKTAAIVQTGIAGRWCAVRGTFLNSHMLYLRDLPQWAMHSEVSNSNCVTLTLRLENATRPHAPAHASGKPMGDVRRLGARCRRLVVNNGPG